MKFPIAESSREGGKGSRTGVTSRRGKARGTGSAARGTGRSSGIDRKPPPKKAAITDAVIKEALDRVIRDTKLSYSINRNLEQVVVKIIDSHTDKIIRTIPAEELIRARESIKRTNSLIFDLDV